MVYIDKFLSTEIDCNYTYNFCSGQGNIYGGGTGQGEIKYSGLCPGDDVCNNCYLDYNDVYDDDNDDDYGCRYDNRPFGNSIKKFNNQIVREIDYIPTIIEYINGNYAKGYILNEDLSTTPCFIAKCGHYFAHGKTLAKARKDAQIKYEENLSIEERIELFNVKYPSNDEPIDGKELFDYHHILTGSCLLGRQSFCKERGLDLNSKYTVREFIAITEGAYGNEVIKKLKESRGL